MLERRETRAEEVSQALGWEGAVVSAVRYAGTTVDVVTRVNHAELERRGSLGAVLDRALLRVLMELPKGVEIPLEVLSPEHVLTLRIDGDGLVEWTPRGVRRTYEPACEVTGILATGRQLRRAVDEVSTFSGFSLRASYGTPRQCAAVRDRAAHFGVGLVAVDDGQPTVIALPERRGIRPSPSRWEFCELAYVWWSENLNEPVTTR